MGLTISQQQGLDHLAKFMHNPNKIWMVLKGAAGTGKTYMINDFLKSINVAKAVAAPTHKAARVIESATGVHAETLHSLHGLRPNFNINDFKVGSMQFDPMGEQRIGNYSVIVIDECSQIPYGLHKLTIDRAKLLNVKIIYIGDPYQLPPIKENNISKTFITEDAFELNQIVRQKEGNKLLLLLTELRNDIKRGTNNVNNALIKAAKNKIYGIDTGVEALSSKMKNDLFDIHFIGSKDIRSTRYTAWRRDTISEANISIRSRLFPNVEDILTKGDILTGYKTLLDQFLATTLVNSDDYIVEEVTYRVDDFGIDCCLVRLKNMDTLSNYTINVVNFKSDTYFSKFLPIIKGLYVRARTAQSKDRRKYWTKYYDFKDSHITLNDIDIYNEEGNVADTIQKELDYGYALTTHKLQGSTVNDIIVNLKDFQGSEYNSKFKNNLLYTALSRAKYRAYTIY